MIDQGKQQKTRQQPSPYARRKLARERMEIYLVHLLLRYRYYLLVPGFLLLLFSFAVMAIDPLAGAIAFLPAALLCLLGSSYSAVLHTARAAAWIATLGEKD